MASKPTISDVAARAGVSKGAVSFALNGRAGVSADTPARILRAASDLGFTPNATARALSTRRSGTLGLVMCRPRETARSAPGIPPFIAGIESALTPSGHLLSVLLVDNEDAEAQAYRELARAGRVDGVFVTDLRADDPRPALPEELGVAAVTLNGPKVPSAAPAVCVDWCAAPSARRPDHRAANPGRLPTAEPTLPRKPRHAPWRRSALPARRVRHEIVPPVTTLPPRCGSRGACRSHAGADRLW